MRALVLPGLDGTGELLTDFVEAMRPDIQADVVTYPRDAGTSYAELTTLAANHPRDERRLLIAESFSGPVAIRLAARHPDRYMGLVLCATFATAPQPLFAPFRHVLDFPLPLPTGGLFERIAMGRWSTGAWRQRIRAVVGSLPPEVVRRRLAEVMAVDVSKELRLLDHPTLYLQATEDWLVPANAWTRIHACAPHAQLVTIAGPHFLLQANPRLAAQAIGKFIRTSLVDP